MRGRNRFGNRNRPGGGQGANAGQTGGGRPFQRHDRRGREGHPEAPGNGGREPRRAGRERASRLGDQLGVGGFELFCAYHLGITPDDRYAFQNIHEVARRFKTNAGMIRQLLEEYEMDPDKIVNSTFDMAAAQVDIMVAPEGISKRELARSLYEEFLAAPRKSRDWAKEIADDARDNERIFGRR